MKGLLAAFLAAVVLAAPLSATASPTGTTTILDTLDPATPTTTFSVFGSGGPTIFENQFAGPQFTLAAPTLITEVGGFVNNCASIFMGIPLCPQTLPLTVQIRPSSGGVPDVAVIIGSFALSHDNDPLVASYESTAPNVVLPPGTYFAVFAPQEADAGYLLGLAQDPFSYTPALTTVGFVHALSGVAASGAQSIAVRILGVVLPASADDCKNDGWRSFGVFKNQGNCVAYAMTGKLKR